MCSFQKAGIEGGKTAFNVMRGVDFCGLIRHFDRASIDRLGLTGEDPHWALLHRSGRTDRFDSLKEAREEARKTYGVSVK